jgi:hypothetical protein
MTNNDILKKLRIALQLRNDDIMKILSLVDFKISESELSAVFRAEDHENYRECGDQLLRNFLNGLIIYKRGPLDPKADADPEALSERTKYDTPKPEYIKSTPKKVLIIKKKQEEPERRKVFLKKKTEGEAENDID